MTFTIMNSTTSDNADTDSDGGALPRFILKDCIIERDGLPMVLFLPQMIGLGQQLVNRVHRLLSFGF